MTTATWITLTQLIAVPLLLGILRWQPVLEQGPSSDWRWWALGIFVVAAGTDWLDGYVARRFNQVSDLGKILDPLVDKLLVVTPLVALVELREVPAWTVCIILLREFAIAGWRSRQAKVSGANYWGKVKTVTQIVAVSLLIAPLGEPWVRISYITYGLAILATIVSGLTYILPSKTSESS